jgi:hypothetical protein
VLHTEFIGINTSTHLEKPRAAQSVLSVNEKRDFNKYVIVEALRTVRPAWFNGFILLLFLYSAKMNGRYVIIA